MGGVGLLLATPVGPADHAIPGSSPSPAGASGAGRAWWAGEDSERWVVGGLPEVSIMQGGVWGWGWVGVYAWGGRREGGGRELLLAMGWLLLALEGEQQVATDLDQGDLLAPPCRFRKTPYRRPPPRHRRHPQPDPQTGLPAGDRRRPCDETGGSSAATGANRDRVHRRHKARGAARERSARDRGPT